MMTPEGLATMLEALENVVGLADQAFSRSGVDREPDFAPLQAAILGILGWAVCEGHCVVKALQSKTPQGVAPNVRSMLEALITAKYLADGDQDERHDRLDRYYRGVRRAQVKLRDALEEYPALKSLYNVDAALAEKERQEYKEAEAALPKERRLKNRHWSCEGEGLKGAAEKIGLGADYAVQYRLHSGSSHGNRPWDQALFDSGNSIIVPSLESGKGMAVPLAFDALRYLAWLLAIAHDSGAVTLYGSEQENLDLYRKYMEPMDALHEKGIVGPDLPD